jgi:heme/copper-type cytochrome/quinol oxidase subunit 4
MLIIQMPVPALFRKRKPKEYKLQVFVAILFLTIILLVGSIYVIHQEKELQVSSIPFLYTMVIIPKL